MGEGMKKGMGMVGSEGSVASYFRIWESRWALRPVRAQVARDSEANAILVAFAPYDDPEIALSIVVERGGSGSLVAGIAAEILEYYFSSKDTISAPVVENTMIR